MPLVSIITPFYNAENTLAAAAASVLAQTFTDWEWILYNDCSTDGGTVISHQLELQDERIKVYSSEVQTGPSNSRNNAVVKSTGEFLAFLDADDVWFPEYLQHRLHDLNRNPGAAFVYGPAVYFYKNRTRTQQTGILKTDFFEPTELINKFISASASTPCPSTAVVRRHAFDRIKGFRAALVRGEDIAFFIELNTHYGAYFQATPLVNYRRHADSATSRANRAGDRLIKELNYCFWLYSFALEQQRSVWLRSAEYYYYAHLVEIAKEKPFFKSRILLFQYLSRSPLSFRAYLFYAFDCLLPFRLAKRVRYYLYRILS
ncbi:MAG: glycosyltransferase family 2 protein [Cyclobacteriaceae bacterium]|nr:glycosyltransferase family 2 protein [Cyclobacteriaceae bacterium]